MCLAQGPQRSDADKSPVINVKTFLPVIVVLSILRTEHYIMLLKQWKGYVKISGNSIPPNLV